MVKVKSWAKNPHKGRDTTIYVCVCVCLFLFIHIENTHWGIYYESPHKDRSVLVPACGWVCALPKSRCSRFQRPVWLLFGSLDFVNVDSVSA